MAKLTRLTRVGLVLLVVIVVSGCGQDKDAIRDLPEGPAKAGHGRTHKPIPPLQEAPGGTAISAGQKAKN